MSNVAGHIEIFVEQVIGAILDDNRSRARRRQRDGMSTTCAWRRATHEAHRVGRNSAVSSSQALVSVLPAPYDPGPFNAPFHRLERLKQVIAMGVVGPTPVQKVRVILLVFSAGIS